ncbi:MinD/ParA family protein [Sphingosinicella humi]|uniref:MinD/ParA family protein n=1 Tax=Allosphingosinicella humi TaxID=2068657 RepID=A0A2U2J106_9SPHN|nr:MinD/ParA family protein [Sphingosinicella humi]PWG02019.1 MinD/ParA family protein [Sphingosinicella humi]
MISLRERSARVIAVTSGKGGVGKTNISVNLSVALARLGKDAMLVDGDMGMANANILLGMNATTTIADVLARDCGLEDVVQQGLSGVRIVPGHSGSGILPGLDRNDRRRLAEAFRPYAGKLDHIIVDTASGIYPEAMELVASSDMILVVLSAEPTAFMDAYALVKVLSLDHGCNAVSVVTNMVEDETSGRALFQHFSEVVRRFLPIRLSHLGSVPRDDHVRESVFRKRCCLEAYPDSRASAAFTRIARVVADAELPATEGGDRFFGMEVLHGAC